MLRSARAIVVLSQFALSSWAHSLTSLSLVQIRAQKTRSLPDDTVLSVHSEFVDNIQERASDNEAQNISAPNQLRPEDHIVEQGSKSKDQKLYAVERGQGRASRSVFNVGDIVRVGGISGEQLAAERLLQTFSDEAIQEMLDNGVIVKDTTPELFEETMEGLVKKPFVEPLVEQPFAKAENFRELSQGEALHAHQLEDADVIQSSEPAWNDMGNTPTSAPVLSADGSDYVSWTLCGKAFHSNLAGVGPDSGEQSIRYFNVTTAGGGQALDLVVTANDTYRVKDEQVNGVSLGTGCFGIVNLKSHFSGYSEVPLLFSWYLHGTNTSVALNKFYFTVSDFDSGPTSQEHVTFYNRVSNIYLSDHALDIEGEFTSIGLTLSSTQQGTGSDNPEDPMALDEEDKTRSVMVEYESQTQWKVNWAITGGKGGRSFYFTGDSNMFDLLHATTTTTTCVTRSCQVFADPHVSGFDNLDNQGPKYLAFYREGGQGTEKGAAGLHLHTFDKSPIDIDAFDVGDFWLVKSQPVHIQARFRLSGEFIPDRAAIGAVAVGGPFLKNHTILVEPLDGQVFVDGVQVSGDWSDTAVGMDLRQEDEESLEAFLPMSVALKFKRFPKHIDVKVTMPELPGGVDGECGNFDGIAENDGDGDVQGRMGGITVEDSLLLFPTRFHQEFNEEDYQTVAAQHSDEAMTSFIMRVLASENKFVPREQESELEGMVPWFSGSMATQSLEKLKEELLGKSWVLDVPARDAAVMDAARETPAVQTPANMVDTPKDSGDESACSACLFWGASHVLSFSAFHKHAARHPKREAFFRVEDWQDSKQLISEAGTYRLVKTDTVEIQGSFWSNGTKSGVLNLGALAISGSFLGGNVLSIRNGLVQWNRERIVNAVSSNFTNRFVTATYTPHAELVSSGLLGNGLHLTFHNGMALTVNYHNRVLDAKIHMCASHVGASTVEGQCGNVHGQHDDGVVSQKANQKLPKEEVLLFDPHTTAPAFVVGDRVRMRDDESSEWLVGNVTSVNPLMVMPDNYDTDFQWDEVEKA